MAVTRPNEFVTLDIESIAFEGVAVARHEGRVFFVKGGLPQEKVIAKILRKKKSYVEAQVEEILIKSDERIEPVCEHFGVCGGCSWQNLNYSSQLFWRKKHIEDAFQRIGKITPGVIFEPMMPPKIYDYRNKMEFSFGASRWLTGEEINLASEVLNKNFTLGLHIPGRFDKVLDIYDCKLQPQLWNDVINFVREKALKFGLTCNNEKSHEGFLRGLVFRRSEYSAETMVILITTTPLKETENEFLDWFKKEFTSLFPSITHIIHAVNNSWSPIAFGECDYIKGSEYLTESILGVMYRISPFSFFQTNSSQLDGFISKILEFADLKSNEVLWDLYCGTGSISLPAARQCKEVFGIELVESSIKDATHNAEINEICNAIFICEDLHSKKVGELLTSLPKPDKIIIDPPRAGMHPNLADYMLNSGVGTIVYVSCNPATQARDCALLSENYEVVKVQPVDMFPQTYHVESIALLKRRNNAG